jgi:2-polyprenyl-3-methyl-5-hydroxy-6-metoxy-1,4-benzoquinol methylase
MSAVKDSKGSCARQNVSSPLATEQTRCNLCGASVSRRLFTETHRLGESEVELGIVRCKRCGLVYVSPRLTFDSTQCLYRHHANKTMTHRYCWQGDPDGARFRRLLGRLAVMRSEGRLLDVGCGVGHFLAEAKRIGKWEVVGVEPSPSVAEQARQRAKCPVYADTLEETPLEPGSFHVVTMLAVLEHLHDPLGTLERVHKLLKPSGLLAVYVPNFHYLRIKDAGIAALLRRGRWSNLHPQEHLFQFTPRSLRMILEAARFQLIDLDIGYPFLHGGAVERWLKMSAYQGVRMLRKLTGLHLGGLEAIARRLDEADTRAAA